MPEKGRSYTIEDEQLLQEKCGLVAVYSKRPQVNLPLALQAAVGVQHRGYHGAGVAVQTEEQTHFYMGSGLLYEIFTPEIIMHNGLGKEGKWVMVHCRYGTSGNYQDSNLQPCRAKTSEGIEISVIHNGEFAATEVMQNKLISQPPDGASDTFLFTQLLAQKQTGSIDERVIETLSEVVGAYSLIIGVEDTLYVARDPMGIRPLFIGEDYHENLIVASETIALNKAGVLPTREVVPGEVIKIDSSGAWTIHQFESTSTHYCSLEEAYFSRPDSMLPTRKSPDDELHPNRWMSYLSFRRRCGELLAEEVDIPNVDFVVGVPDSGLHIATGFAQKKGLPLYHYILREHYIAEGQRRTFMRDDEMEKISQRVDAKLTIVGDRNLWEDKIVAIADDSIIRGNVTERITAAIRELGAKEVHLIVGFPPVLHTCHLGVSMRTQKELVAARAGANLDKVTRLIGADSVHYISARAFLQARLDEHIAIPTNEQEVFLANGECGGCITGVYPVSKEGVVYKSNIAMI